MWFFRDRRHPAAPPVTSVFVVSSARGVDEIFAFEKDARRYAADIDGARVGRHVLRSLDDAVVVLDRRIVVDGATVRSDQTARICLFVDPWCVPDPADVEWFAGDVPDEWHIVGFGSDEAELDARISAVVREVGQHSAASSSQGASAG